MFPDCFYFPAEGEISEVSRDDYQQAIIHVKELLDMINDFVRDGQLDDDSWEQLINVSAFNLMKIGTINAFRTAARSISYTVPSVAQNPLWNILEVADEFAAFCEK